VRIAAIRDRHEVIRLLMGDRFYTLPSTNHDVALARCFKDVGLLKFRCFNALDPTSDIPPGARFEMKWTIIPLDYPPILPILFPDYPSYNSHNYQLINNRLSRSCPLKWCGPNEFKAPSSEVFTPGASGSVVVSNETILVGMFVHASKADNRIGYIVSALDIQLVHSGFLSSSDRPSSQLMLIDPDRNFKLHPYIPPEGWHPCNSSPGPQISLEMSHPVVGIHKVAFPCSASVLSTCDDGAKADLDDSKSLTHTGKFSTH
jgi:hypothetical protein